MSSFTDRINEKKDFLSKKGNLSHVSYGMFRLWRALRPVTVRLPVTTIAKMKLLEEKCAIQWESKQEMLFDMIECCIKDWINLQPSASKIAGEFDRAARRALQQGMGSDASEDAATDI